MAEALPSIQEVASKIMGQAAAPATAEPEAVEAAPEAEAPAAEPAPAPEAPKEDKFGARFAALSRKEKALRQQQKDMESRQAALEARQAEIKARDEHWSNIKKSPLKALKAAGISYDEVTQEVLGTREEPAIDPVEARYQALEARLAKAEALEQELNRFKAQASDEKIQAGEKALRDNFANTISENKDKYEISANMGTEAIDLAREIVGQYFEKHNEVLTYAEVLDMVEAHYEEQVLKKVLTTKKAKEMMGSFNKPAPSETPKSVPAKTAKPATLTNAAKARNDTVNIDTLPKHQALDHLVKKYINS